MVTATITNAETISEMHFDSEVDAMYESLRTEFAFIRKEESGAQLRDKKKKHIIFSK